MFLFYFCECDYQNISYIKFGLFLSGGYIFREIFFAIKYLRMFTGVSTNTCNGGIYTLIIIIIIIQFVLPNMAMCIAGPT